MFLLQYDLMGKLRSVKHYLLLDQVLMLVDHWVWDLKILLKMSSALCWRSKLSYVMKRPIALFLV